MPRSQVRVGCVALDCRVRSLGGLVLVGPVPTHRLVLKDSFKIVGLEIGEFLFSWSQSPTSTRIQGLVD